MRSICAAIIVLAVAPQTKTAPVRILSGTAPVCEAVRQSLATNPNELSLEQPKWADSEASLPDELNGAQESRFDFDNDGTPDRVFMRGFSDHYMQSTVLLVDLTGDASQRWFLPCQLDAAAIPLAECPPFTQKHDEAGFTLRGPTPKQNARYRARYTDLTPFRFQGSTYLEVESHTDTARFVGVIKPLAGRKYEQTCLLYDSKH